MIKRRPKGQPVSVVRLTVAGAPIVRVYVLGAEHYAARVNPRATPYATLDAVDWDRLVADGVSQNWVLNASKKSYPLQSYVRVRMPGFGLRQVAQLVAQTRRGCGISYRDGNPLNLRRSNLVIGGGRSKGDCAPPAMDYEMAPASSAVALNGALADLTADLEAGSPLHDICSRCKGTPR